MNIRHILFLPFLLIACGERPATPPEDTYPWQITVIDPAHSRVFGITLGQTRLGEAATMLGRDYKLALFEEPDGRLSLEVYYKEITRGGLSGRLIMILDAGEDELAGIRDRATRREVLETGNIRYTLGEPDRLAAADRVIVGLDYIPYVNLDAETIEARFGAPAERIRLDDRRQHWLYPNRGLDILLNADGRELLQYVPPAAFEALVRPLRQAAQGAESSTL